MSELNTTGKTLALEHLSNRLSRSNIRVSSTGPVIPILISNAETSRHPVGSFWRVNIAISVFWLGAVESNCDTRTSRVTSTESA